ncbi:hypothetical protein [Caudoviricetes sp.]|nr:hypothetical protein [Caudoviricetes sp.]
MKVFTELHPNQQFVRAEISGGVWVGTPESIELIKELSQRKKSNIVWWGEPPIPINLEGTIFDFSRFLK